MKIIFCEDPLNKKHPDEMYQAEAEAAQLAGFDFELVNYEALVYEKNSQKAIQLIPTTDSEILGIYRGWMLKPVHYTALFQSLLEKGIRLINDPMAYQHCHYLPESYEIIEPITPHSEWLPVDGSFVDFDAVMELLAPFGAKSIIVKDFVKSQKHFWNEACFIPDASNREQVEKIVTRFMELQDSDLNEGLVFREFIELESLTIHSKSGMPLTKEYRLFVLGHQPLIVSEYWEEGDYQDTQPPLAVFSNEIANVQSQFFTMDIAKTVNGDWIIMELGDGQVAGLPDRIDITAFYRSLAQNAA